MLADEKKEDHTAHHSELCTGGVKTRLVGVGMLNPVHWRKHLHVSMRTGATEEGGLVRLITAGVLYVVYLR